MFLSFFTLCNSFFTRSIQMVFSILLQNHMSKGTTDLLSEVSKFQHLYYLRLLKLKMSFGTTQFQTFFNADAVYLVEYQDRLK